MQQDNKLLERLGYNQKDKATILLKDLVSEVSDLMNQHEKEEIKELIDNKTSYIYVELACFDYEIGLNKFNEEIERVHRERNVDKIDMELYTDIFNDDINPSVENAVFSIAEFMNKTDSKEETVNKENNKLVVDKAKVLSLA